jgi:hypothetical protein
MSRSVQVLITIAWMVVALTSAATGCSRRDPASEPPAAPAMPADWKVAKDDVADRNKVWEFQYRLEGKLKAVRMTLYMVNGKRVQLNTIVPRDSTELDKCYRMLANKRVQGTYLRKNELLYEFIGTPDATNEVAKGFEALSH